MALTPQARRALELGASHALYEAHSLVMAIEPNADEPRHVCIMTQWGSLLLHDAWEAILAQVGVQLRVTGVFCHQTPKAHFPYQGRPASPELGDLLIVHEHLHPTAPRRRALLVQAKMASNGRPTGAPNAKQEHLYQAWPDFILRGHGGGTTGGRFLDGHRNLRSNARGCTYALIENTQLPIGIHGHLLPSVWRFARPGGGGPSRNAALTLSDMVLGRSGAGRPALMPMGSLEDPKTRGHLAKNSPRGFHWSATVQELLDLTAAKRLPTRMPGPLVPDRGVAFSFMQYGSMAHRGGSGDAYSGGGDRIPAEVREEPPGAGITIILVETSGGGLDEEMPD